MLTLPSEVEVLEKLVAWANAQPTVRAMIMTSTRTRPNGSVDLLSDYDIIIAVTNPERFAQNDDWAFDYGSPMVRWGDESKLCGLPTYFRGVVYQDYVKIDWSIWPDAMLERIGEQTAMPDELDAGYRVLLDKDGGTAGWKPPTYRAYIPARPTEAEYRALVEEFWWGATYFAKSLWRDELVFAKWILDQDMKTVAMRRMLEWHIEIDHDWSLKPGVLGRGLKQFLPTDYWTPLANTYVGADLEENWAALWRTADLFRRVAREVGDALGYAYPQEVDEQVSVYVNTIRQLPPRPNLPLV